jgi:hypothetical protein
VYERERGTTWSCISRLAEETLGGVATELQLSRTACSLSFTACDAAPIDQVLPFVDILYSEGSRD